MQRLIKNTSELNIRRYQNFPGVLSSSMLTDHFPHATVVVEEPSRSGKVPQKKVVQKVPAFEMPKSRSCSWAIPAWGQRLHWNTKRRRFCHRSRPRFHPPAANVGTLKTACCSTPEKIPVPNSWFMWLTQRLTPPPHPHSLGKWKILSDRGAWVQFVVVKSFFCCLLSFGKIKKQPILLHWTRWKCL